MYIRPISMYESAALHKCCDWNRSLLTCSVLNIHVINAPPTEVNRWEEKREKDMKIFRDVAPLASGVDVKKRTRTRGSGGVFKEARRTLSRPTTAAGAAPPWTRRRVATLTQSRVCAYCWNNAVTLWQVHQLFDILSNRSKTFTSNKRTSLL